MSNRIAAYGARRAGCLLAVACVLAACGKTPEPGDIILVTVDTLRADHVGLYGYERDTTPHLDRFFGDGAVVERAYSTEANTSPSVVSILSGLLPQEHRVRLMYQMLPEDATLIPDLLPERYQSAGFVANIVLTDEAIGLGRHFDHYDDFIDENVAEPGATLYERNARRTTDAALLWLRERRDPARPLFLWVHYIDPHAPYRSPERSEKSYDHPHPRPIDVSRLAGSVREPGVDDGLAYVDRYDEEVAYTDVQIERLLSGYAEQAPVDEALVIFTADHGESMMEHEMWFAHGYHVYDEIVRVPFMLRGPGVRGGRLSGLGSGIDVAPTVLSFAGVPVPETMRGFDLRGLDSLPADRSVFSEATSPLVFLLPDQGREVVAYWRAEVRGREKWMVGMIRGSRDARERRYYDLARDPDELSPEPGAGPEAAAPRLMELIDSDPDPGGLPAKLRVGIRIDAPKVDPRATEAQRERLRALGYVE